MYYQVELAKQQKLWYETATGRCEISSRLRKAHFSTSFKLIVLHRSSVQIIGFSVHHPPFVINNSKYELTHQVSGDRDSAQLRCNQCDIRAVERRKLCVLSRTQDVCETRAMTVQRTLSLNQCEQTRIAAGITQNFRVSRYRLHLQDINGTINAFDVHLEL